LPLFVLNSLRQACCQHGKLPISVSDGCHHYTSDTFGDKRWPDTL
jgi:hypothetical protein